MAIYGFGKNPAAKAAIINGQKTMIDSFGRNIDYLRLSITDRCNLRCLYCMPREGVDWIPHNDILRFEEILTICRILAGLGINTIKVTGGEPLVRRGALDLIRQLKAIDRSMIIGDIRLWEKSGGKSGHYKRAENND